MEYKNSEEVVPDLIPIYSSLDALVDFMPVKEAQEYLDKAKAYLEKGKKDKAKEEAKVCRPKRWAWPFLATAGEKSARARLHRHGPQQEELGDPHLPPPDGNCLRAVVDHCLRSRGYVNLIVAGKQPELRLGLVNVVDLMTLSPAAYHPHGLDEATFVDLFTADKEVIFAFHGYPRMVHDLVHGRPNPGGFHVRGYQEEGTTTPFDMVVVNQMSRFHLAIEALKRVSRLRSKAAHLVEQFEQQLTAHRHYVREQLEDMPAIRDWTWAEP